MLDLSWNRVGGWGGVCPTQSTSDDVGVHRKERGRRHGHLAEPGKYCNHERSSSYEMVH